MFLALLGIYQYNKLLLLWGIAEEKKQVKQGTYTSLVYFHFVYTFCMLLFNRILYSQNSFPFYLLQDIVLPLSGDFGTMDP